jgi:hypothetical protein
VIDADAKGARIESELRYLIGQGAPVAGVSRVAEAAPGRGGPARTVPLQLPTGPMVEKIREALLKTAQLDVTETPMSDVLTQLSDAQGITVRFDKGALDDAGFQPDSPVTMNLRGITLAALFQAMQDDFRVLEFVVRDYGILLTTVDRAKEAGYYPALDLARQSSGAGLGPQTTYPSTNPLARPQPR